ncbi:Coenzyme F420 hydrogenase/dehydrogenase, beta subunit C-terminal domain [Oribacterium sp. WCC10]|uniref:Coenzyme F420 hydrogenase/dehydrogenase, beta subunit C-terminal domain n=1 Tax=Oribacterium sp. WCC10 TaxID=1855343 RepID=UPI0008DF6691|nr:Coenzyme F420 hydrogenase/dehydrogenase, beta subunit C-terminal domain [Oribacterium sp. WCC10]SFG64938.1 Coenzyme F420 hydrogenase/dehydrogenase, beta subunit N-term [Oribacterium sp. WCC10]
MSTTKSFAAYNKDESIRAMSSSGGVFYAMAQKTLSEGGIVFGAAFDSEWQVHHEACSSIQDLQRIMQSKYVQSSMGNTYTNVRGALLSGEKVLFCGTPCQVEGLISYLTNTIKDNAWKELLVTIDFICHGVPSRMVWRRYLREVSEDKKITNINFRDKTNGWRNFGLRIDFDNGNSYLQSQHKDPYMRGFLNNLYLRESCYECSFRGIERESDFTIADFWGVHTLLPDFFDDKGTSIILAHNDRAIRILEELSKTVNLCEIQNDVVIQTNSPVVKSVNRNSKRDSFFEHNGGKDISKYIVHSIHQPLLTRIKRKIFKTLHF